MKNTVKLFGLLMVSIVLFSCSTDEQDEDLEKAIKLSENMQQTQSREGDGIQEEGNPHIIIIKKD
ncbi:hypothetical protein [Flavobacterium helocola]|uniref:Lipoprotein n=1 Tax=Flavobacterium helocola TaxID=3139139 RepID=A0ABU9I4X7_9FLAO